MGEFDPPQALVPDNCWALKRGKMHVNDPSAGTLCCSHRLASQAALEVPMIARGTVYGLLTVAGNAQDRAANVKEVARIARALADTMSLALSNIALREKLRTQSLRDPLRDAAVQLVGALRPADVVSRYGGEELPVILPTCPLEDAVL